MLHTARSRLRYAILATALFGAACSGDPQGPALVPDGNLVDITAVVGGSQILAVGVDMAISGTNYVPGGDRVVVGRSDNATTWQWVDVGVPGALLDVAWGNGTYAAAGVRVDAGGNATGILLSSTDGVTWDEAPAPVISSWHSVAWGNDMFMAAGSTGLESVLAISTDGTEWEGAVITGMTNVSVSFAGGRFHVTGNAGVVFSSPDGDTWQTRTLNAVDRVSTFIDYDNGIAAYADCCVGALPDNVLYFRIAGPAQGTLQLDTATYRSFVREMAYGNNVFVGLTQRELVRSADLLEWNTTFTADSDGTLQDVVYASNHFVTVGGRVVRTSVDGTSWTEIAVPESIAER